MTLFIYTGTPGSGKTLHAVERGLSAQRRPGGVVANFEITKGKRWLYLPETEMTPELLMDHAVRYHKEGKEAQGMLIIDEAHRVFSAVRSMDKTTFNTRLPWIRFMAEHRHFGWDVLLIAQSDFMIDKQIRAIIEREVIHRKLNQQFWWLPFPVFLRFDRWYGVKSMKPSIEAKFFPEGRGRYDHQAMRRRVLASRVPLGAGSPSVGSELVTGQSQS